MDNYARILQTPLTQLPFSPACLRWFRDAGVHTVEEAEDGICLLAESKYYSKELVQEMVRVIHTYIDAEKNKLQTQPEQQPSEAECLSGEIKRNNALFFRLMQRLKKLWSR